MGWGAHGWDGASGPVAFSAWSLEQLGWIGTDDGRLVSVKGDRRDLVSRDVFSGGTVYKIPLRAETPDNGTLWVEYLLLEYRDREAHYYNRGQPASGLLVWHVRPQAFDNDDEQHKRLDLVAADGLYRDAGFPAGQVDDRYAGGTISTTGRTTRLMHVRTAAIWATRPISLTACATAVWQSGPIPRHCHRRP